MSPFYQRYAWHRPGQLDAEAIRRAAGALVGEHDFASFASNPKREIESTVRHLLAIDVRESGDWLFLCVTGRAFLYRMVRTLAGYMVKVGAGKCPAEDTPARIAARDRTTLGADTAPPQGLFLAKVFFSQEDYAAYNPILPPFIAHLTPGPQYSGA